MSEYIAVRPIRHDGEKYAPGDSIELSKDQAAPLEALGAVIKGEASESATKAAKAKGGK